MGDEIVRLGGRVEESVPCSAEQRNITIHRKSVKSSKKIEHCYKRPTCFFFE